MHAFVRIVLPRLLFVLLVIAVVGGCGGKRKGLAPDSQSFGELRAVRGRVQVTPPGEGARALVPRERLVDGEQIDVPADALAWLRRDGGATLLVRGPASLVFGRDALEVREGRLFVDAPGRVATVVGTPQGRMHLARVRASLEVGQGGASTDVYVLAGEVRTEDGTRAGPGERLVVKRAADAKPQVVAATAWEDWTGGLATTDKGAEPPPFGVGTIGARKPGNQGAPHLPLAIRRMDVRVTVEGDLATTEVDQLFFNGSSATVEGMYSFRTPLGAVLTRFGVDRDGVVVWGRVKEKATATRQYESHVYEGSREDPALLTWDAPGVYRARLYPIHAGETRRVVVRYSEWLKRTGARGERRLYVFPMAAEGAEESLPRIEFFGATFDLQRAGARRIRAGMRGLIEKDRVVVRAHDIIPRADLAVELFDEGILATRAFRSSHGVDEELVAPSQRVEARERARQEADYLMIPLRAADVPSPAGGIDLVIVVDGSAAMDDAALAIARASVGAMLAHLHGDDRAVVWAGDASLRPVARGWTTLRKVDPSVRQLASIGLATLQRGGATDLGAMLAEAATQLDAARRGAVVYVGDGRATVGELVLADLQERMGKLPRPVRVFGLGVGTEANMAVLEGIAQGGFAERLGDAATAARVALQLLESVERPAWVGASVDLGPSLERVYPRALNTLVEGESVMLVGRVSGPVPKTIDLRTPAGVTTLRVLPQRVVDGGDLQARWAEARLRQMLADGEGSAALVDLGVRSGIITPFTSLYVPTKGEMSAEEFEALRRKQRERGARWQPEGELLREAIVGLPALFAGCQQAQRSLADEEAPASPVAAAPAPEDKPTEEQGVTGSMAPRSESRATQRAPTEPRQPAGGEKAKAAAAALVKEEDRESEEPTAGSAPAPPAEGAWGRDDSLGSDPLSARGNTWGDAIGESFGAGGLGLSGIGEGGGSRGEGIGLGAVGTVGHGAGTGTGQGFGSGHGRLGGSQRARPPRVRMGATTVQGSLPAEVIQRIVRQNFGRFRLCYEQGLRNNPNLQGRVVTRIVIGRDGSVQVAANAGGDLPDPQVVQCVVAGFRELSFPEPAGGIVTAVYPIMFAPADGSGMGKDDDQHEPVHASGVKVTVEIKGLPHLPWLCAPSSSIPFAERVGLWRERLARAGGSTAGVASVYRVAVESCEAPTWRERSKLLSMMLDALPTVRARVELWRLMQGSSAVADALYRGILARTRTADDMRQLHDALGLRSADPALLDKLAKDTKDPKALAEKLRVLRVQWPDDFGLALRLLDAYEDAGDDAGARDLARLLRMRPDADAHVRTEIGEHYLRLASRAATPEQRAADEAEARRTFGEIVEYAPDEPIARRRLGDLLRAHGWHAEAARQYETLAKLTPDDAGVSLLLASAANGLGKLDEALRWTEKVSGAGSPGMADGLAVTARSMGATFLAWGRDDAAKANRTKELDILRKHSERLLARDDVDANAVRAVLLWSHPELHLTLWSNARSTMLPAPEGDVSLGVAQVLLPKRPDAAVEVAIDERDVDHAARLGATATLTVIFEEAKPAEKVVRVPVRFTRGGPARVRFLIGEGEVQQ